MTERMMLWPEVHHLVGLSRTTIWRLERTGQFPRRVLLSARAVGWQESELKAWLAKRLAARDGRDVSPTTRQPTLDKCGFGGR
jgi:prophage regulatory protein